MESLGLWGKRSVRLREGRFKLGKPGRGLTTF
jgi:hypothetical protein